MTKNSNIKRMGVKSVHYYDNNVVIENSFSKQQSLIYDVRYDNVEQLKNATEKKQFDKTNAVEFVDIKNKKGFRLFKKIKGLNFVSNIKNVKTISYAQQVFGVTDKNNIEIQIYQNYEDIRKIIANHCNHVMYSLNSVAQIHLPNNNIFDLIGMLTPTTAFEDFDQSRYAYNSISMKNQVIPAFSKTLPMFGVSLEKKKGKQKIDFVEMLKYVESKYNSQVQQPNLNNEQKQVIDYLLRTKEQQLRQLAKTKANELDQAFERACIPVFRFQFRNPRQKDILNNALAKKPLCQEIETAINRFYQNQLEQTDKTVYDYLRLLSTIRNYTLHGNLDIECFNSQSLVSIAKQDIDLFAKNFVQSNNKYFNILSQLYAPSDKQNIYQEFFEYSVFGDIKNVGFSIDKARKLITEQLEISIEDCENKQNASEYMNKFKKLLGFDLYQRLKKSTQLSDLVIDLKQAEDEIEKQQVYQDFADKYISQNKDFAFKLKKLVLKNIGKIENAPKIETNITFNSEEYCKNNFINLLYVFCTFLTKKDSNSLFAEIINKIESIADLISLAKILNININQNTFKNYENIVSINADFEKTKRQLNLLRNLKNSASAKLVKDKKSSLNDKQLEKIYNCFPNRNYSFEQFKQDTQKNEKGEVMTQKTRQTKPLRNFLRNNVYVSKQFEYLLAYSDTKICPLVAKQKNLVEFVLNDMLGINKTTQDVEDCVDMQHQAMYRYISKVYHDFVMDKASENSADFYINKNQLAQLVDYISTFDLQYLTDSLFGKSQKNYTVIVRLYLTVCYLIVKNIMNQNSSYFIAFEDYSNYYKKTQNTNSDKIIDLSVVDHYLTHSNNKNSRSFRQLESLTKKEYIQNYKDNDNYKNLLKKYRNNVAHCSILADLDLWKQQFENVTSYFALYQILMQNNLKRYIQNAYGENANELFKLDNNKSYSTKLCIALNMPLAYNISRFNNLTIEKYATKNK